MSSTRAPRSAMSRGDSLLFDSSWRRDLVSHAPQLLVHPGDRLIHRRLARCGQLGLLDEGRPVLGRAQVGRRPGRRQRLSVEEPPRPGVAAAAIAGRWSGSGAGGPPRGSAGTKRGGAGDCARARCWAATRLPTPSASGSAAAPPHRAAAAVNSATSAWLRRSSARGPTPPTNTPTSRASAPTTSNFPIVHRDLAGPARRRKRDRAHGSLSGESQKTSCTTTRRLARRLRRIHLKSTPPRTRVAGSRCRPSLLTPPLPATLVHLPGTRSA